MCGCVRASEPATEIVSSSSYAYTCSWSLDLDANMHGHIQKYSHILTTFTDSVSKSSFRESGGGLIYVYGRARARLCVCVCVCACMCVCVACMRLHMLWRMHTLLTCIYMHAHINADTQRKRENWQPHRILRHTTLWDTFTEHHFRYRAPPQNTILLSDRCTSTTCQLPVPHTRRQQRQGRTWYFFADCRCLA